MLLLIRWSLPQCGSGILPRFPLDSISYVLSSVYSIGAASAIRPGLQPGELSTQAGLAQGNQRLVIAQPSGEADQDGGPDCALYSADCLPIG